MLAGLHLSTLQILNDIVDRLPDCAVYALHLTSSEFCRYTKPYVRTYIDIILALCPTWLIIVHNDLLHFLDATNHHQLLTFLHFLVSRRASQALLKSHLESCRKKFWKPFAKRRRQHSVSHCCKLSVSAFPPRNPPIHECRCESAVVWAIADFTHEEAVAFIEEQYRPNTIAVAVIERGDFAALRS